MTAASSPDRSSTSPVTGDVSTGRKGMVWVLADAVFSFEMLFVLFLFAGRYKVDPRFQWIPVDLTALTFGLSVGCGALVLLRRRPFSVSLSGVRVVAVYALFAGYSVASLLWSPSRSYGGTKALYLVTLVAWCLVAPVLIVAASEDRQRRLIVALAVFASWIGLETALAYVGGSGTGFVTALGGSGNYLGIGRTLGIGMVSLLVGGLFLFEGRLWPALAIGMAAALAGLLLVVGGRGPFLASVASVAVLFAMMGRLSASRGLVLPRRVAWLGAIAAVGVAVTAAVVARAGLTTTLVRLQLLFSGSLGASAGARVTWMREALDGWVDAPVVGHGLGSWPVLLDMKDARGYPHNLLLETGFEGGLVGVALLAALCALALRTSMRAGPLRTPTRVFALLLFVNTLLNAMVSGDVSDNRVVFVAVGLLAAPPLLPPDTTRRTTVEGAS